VFVKICGITQIRADAEAIGRRRRRCAWVQFCRERALRGPGGCDGVDYDLPDSVIRLRYGESDSGVCERDCAIDALIACNYMEPNRGICLSLLRRKCTVEGSFVIGRDMQLLIFIRSTAAGYGGGDDLANRNAVSMEWARDICRNTAGNLSSPVV